MRTRRLGQTELNLTVIGLGTWAIGGPWEYGWGPQDDDEAIGAIFEGLDEGINWIDTAPVYGCGHSEELVGKALRQSKVKPYIATKLGSLWNDKKEKISCLKKESVREECHASLKRLGVDVIDLYQIHWPIPDEDIEEAWEEMAKLQKEGKVKYLGVSNFNVEQIKRVQKNHSPDSLQPPYSMVHRNIEEDILDYCAKSNIGVLAYSPMQKGLLTGKCSKQWLSNLPADDLRTFSPEFQEPQFGHTLELVEKLSIIAKRNERTMPQLAIAWVLSKEAITAAIVGARKPGQIRETAKAADWEISVEDLQEIDSLLNEWQHKTKRP